MPTDHSEERGAHLRRDPGQDAVADDVIERSSAFRKINDRLRAKNNVLQIHPRDEVLPAPDLRVRQVDAEKFGLRVLSGHRNDIAAAAATEFKHAALVKLRRRQIKESPDREEMRDMSLRV